MMIIKESMQIEYIVGAIYNRYEPLFLAIEKLILCQKKEEELSEK